MPLRQILKAISFDMIDLEAWKADDDQFKDEYNIAHFTAVETGIDKIRSNTDLKSQAYILSHIDDGFSDSGAKPISAHTLDEAKQAIHSLLGIRSNTSVDEDEE